MKVKKYLLVFVILFMTLSSLAIINISVKPVQAAPFHDLTVQSTPFVGVDFTINGTSYTTNTSVNLDQGFYTVSMPSTWMNGSDQYTFMRWEDGSINPVRIVSLTGDETIIAFYRHVKVYVDQPGGYIPGEPVGPRFTVDIIIEVNDIADNSPEGIIGWGLYVQVDPDVLNITRAKGVTSGYFLWEFADYEWLDYPVIYTFFNATRGFGDVSEFIAPTPPGGAGDGYSGFKLVTLEFVSKSETAYSKIDLFNVEYQTPDGMWHDVDEVIDGHYNEYIPHDLTVESTPIDGINFTASMHEYDSTDYTTNTTVILPEGNRTVTMPHPWMVGADQYNFVEWEDNSTDPERTMNLTSNTTIIATYVRALKNYTLTVNSEPITGVDFTIGSTDYATNQSIILWEGDYTVTMSSTWMDGTDKYIFRHWEDSSTNPQRTISLTSNKTINATYGLMKNYTLTVNSVPITGVDFTIYWTTYETNTSVSLLEGFHTVTISSTKMVGADRYDFVEWEDSSTNPVRVVSLTSNTTITATYAVPYVKVYVNQTLGYIPGQPSGQTVTVDIIIEVNNITDNSPRGIIGWTMDIQVDPDVLNITQAIGATSGYFLWNFSDNYFYNPPGLFQGTINTTSGYWDTLEETVVSLGGAGDGSSYPTSSNKLVTLEFTSKSETAYSIIDLINVYYMIGSAWYPVDEVVDGNYNLRARADIDPDTLNLKSKRKWITAYIELPEGFNVSDIDISTIMLNGTIPVSLLDVPAPEPVPTEIGDYDNDGIPDLMVKFNTTMVIEFLLSKGIMYGNVTLTITGEVNGTPFEGRDTIKVLFPGDVDDDGDVDRYDCGLLAEAYGTSVDDAAYVWFADFNEDQNIDRYDCGILAEYYGKTAV